MFSRNIQSRKDVELYAWKYDCKETFPIFILSLSNAKNVMYSEQWLENQLCYLRTCLNDTKKTIELTNIEPLVRILIKM